MATTLPPGEAAAVLKDALKGFRGDVTVADAAAKAGLALRDAERGLHHLLTEYPGHLSATDEGELLFKFPRGFSTPLFERPAWRRFVDKTKQVVFGVGKFVLRAWISIVLVGYVAVFLAIAIALALRGGGDDDDGGGAFGLVYVLLRVVAEALFWTFHPFSPFAARSIYDDPRARRRGGFAEKKKKKEPFYARVNRFVFGPEEEKLDPRELERRLLAQIRAQRGRIGLSDVLRVTGLPRQEADALLARLMLDYDGEVDVSDDGGVFYSFPSIRKTAGEAPAAPPPPAWTRRKQAPPLTGNDAGSNVLIGALNAFNLLMSVVAMGAGLTLERLQALIAAVPPEMFPPAGLPIVLGVIPFVFSTLIFALPAWRAAAAGRTKKAIARENARQALLQVVLDGVEKGGVSAGALQRAWRDAAGEAPSDKELVREVVALGGDVDVKDSGRAQFRFRDLEAEVAALQKERAAASDAEQRVGQVVFSSDDGSGREPSG